MHSTTEHSTTEHSTTEHSTTEHSTTEHSTAQDSIAEHSNAEHDLGDGSPGTPACGGLSRLGARRIFFVGFTCFALWLLADAQVLYENALASPLGARRTVALSVLRPLARLDQAVGLSRLTAAADDLLGRNGTAGGSVVRGGPPKSISEASDRERAEWVPASAATTSLWPPAVVQPSASHPLVLLDIGDSLGEDLGFGLADVLPSPVFDVIQDAVGDTGLARPDYYDWPAHLSEELAQYHPEVVVVFLGANDAQSFMDGGDVVTFGTPTWQADYAARVAEIMDEVGEAGAHLLWVGMPIMQSPGLSEDMQTLNAIYARKASLHAGVTYFSSWNVFTTVSGSYDEYLPDSSGTEELVRDSDGVHLTNSGDDRLAQAVATAIENDWHIKP